MSSQFPLIGVTCHADTGGEEDIFPGRALNYIDRTYSDVLIKHDMIPVMIPVNQSSEYISRLLKKVDGLVCTGGGKIQEHILNQDKIPSLRETAPQRYQFEKLFFKQALDKDIPIFGVCRSMQTINELWGGRIISKISHEIPDAIQHNQTNLSIPKEKPYHKITIKEDSKLAEILGKNEIKVNSWHSQSIEEPGDGFEVVAQTEDGVIEATESIENTFVVLTQFHPELLVKTEEIWNNLFKKLRKEALNYNKYKK